MRFVHLVLDVARCLPALTLFLLGWVGLVFTLPWVHGLVEPVSRLDVVTPFDYAMTAFAALCMVVGLLGFRLALRRWS